jgi:hypothetical protein
MLFSTQRPAWQKLFAGFLLLWALADLSVPGLCKTDDDDRSSDSQVISQPDSAFQTQQSPSGTNLRDASYRGRQGAPNVEEDCFCCCAHLVPSAHFQAVAIEGLSQASTFYRFIQVTASAAPPYHPPRS